MTLHDLVSYAHKHNEANGENDADGTSENHSSNWGVEGQTEDEAIVELRERLKRAMLVTLFASLGTPMLLGGDEFGRSQQGNNNAYCQDSPISWLHWDTSRLWWDQLELTRRLLQLRAEHPVLRRDRFRHGEAILDILRGSRHTIIIENNYSGQFARYLRSETSYVPNGYIRKYDGEPFMPHHIVEAVKEQLAGSTKLSVPVHEIMV